MKKVEQLIIENNLIKPHEVVAVACSGGQDSMCLLNVLNNLTAKLNFTLVAINIDHNLRESSKGDSAFVKNYCDTHGIKLYAYSLDVREYCLKHKVGLEQGARDARYKVFKKLLDKGAVDKIALGHHQSDQAETILLNIFRGAGISGACGMELIREGKYIRPFLYTPKTEIKAYCAKEDIPFVEDETNAKNDYNRNYIRNMILPMIRSRWANADATICEFGKLCKKDNDYINSQVSDRAMIKENESTVKVYSSYFHDDLSVVSRIILKALKEIGASVDVEKKHLKMINDLVLHGENGAKVNLPNKVIAVKEYNFITFTNKNSKSTLKPIKFKQGKFDIPNVGALEVFSANAKNIHEYQNVFDAKKLPKSATWRFRKQGDTFEKFGGGGRVSLNEFLIDKKVPSRFRDSIPVLALENEIFVIAGIEISDSVKVDKSTTSAYGVNFIRF